MIERHTERIRHGKTSFSVLEMDFENDSLAPSYSRILLLLRAKKNLHQFHFQLKEKGHGELAGSSALFNFGEVTKRSFSSCSFFLYKCILAHDGSTWQMKFNFPLLISTPSRSRESGQGRRSKGNEDIEGRIIFNRFRTENLDAMRVGNRNEWGGPGGPFFKGCQNTQGGTKSLTFSPWELYKIHHAAMAHPESGTSSPPGVCHLRQWQKWMGKGFNLSTFVLISYLMPTWC